MPRETELTFSPVSVGKRIAVVGAGPAGLAFATTAASRGHSVTLFDASAEIGGQFNLAKRIPGKEEFVETIRYFARMLQKTGVEVKLGKRVTAGELLAAKFDEVVLATGVTPRRPAIVPPSREEFLAHWGIDPSASARGGVEKIERRIKPSKRKIFLLQRKEGRPGAGLGKTTGWIHRTTLKDFGVEMWGGVTYRKIDDRGLHITREGRDDKVQVLDVDHVVICAGQEPLRELEAELKGAGASVHRIGGADVAAELDAKRAIEQGTRLAARL